MKTVPSSPRAADPERGLTLVELMITMVIASIVMMFILGIQVRMTSGFRAAEKTTDVQQTLLTIRQQLVRDLRNAGNRIGLLAGADCTSQQARPGCGIAIPSTSSGPRYLQPLSVDNAAGSDTADVLALFYADDSFALSVDSFPAAGQTITYATSMTGTEVSARLGAGDRVLLVSQVFEDVDSDPDTPDRVSNAVCAVEITDLSTAARTVTFGVGSSLNSIDLAHCEGVRDNVGTGMTRLYPLVGRAYRVDPDDRAFSILQVSPSGQLDAGDWENVAIGVTTLQLATRLYEPGDVNDDDGDGDPLLDWYSSSNQEVWSPGAVPVQMSVSIEVRSPYEVQGASPSATPSHTTGSSANNEIGDLPATALEGVPDASRPVQYRGDHIYRSLRFTVDLRNLGVQS